MSRARDVANFLPPVGPAGTVLTKIDITSYNMEWSAAGAGLPPVDPTEDAGKALVISPTNSPAWGEPVDASTQIVDGGIVL